MHQHFDVRTATADHRAFDVVLVLFEPAGRRLCQKIRLGPVIVMINDRQPAGRPVLLVVPDFQLQVRAEQHPAAAEVAHRHGALLIVVFTEAVSLGLLTPPDEADIVCGELQSFAISPSYGGPFAGVIATREKFVRQMPGRLVGQTTDSRGNRAFCLTLSTREQHIRREKATSNICTNQALVALLATVFMTVYGKQGLRELALQNLAKAHYLGDRVKRRFSGPYFNEFVAATPDPAGVNGQLLGRKIVGGLDLGRSYPELSDGLRLCATEMSKRADMDTLAEVLNA